MWRRNLQVGRDVEGLVVERVLLCEGWLGPDVGQRLM